MFPPHLNWKTGIRPSLKPETFRKLSTVLWENELDLNTCYVNEEIISLLTHGVITVGRQ